VAAVGKRIGMGALKENKSDHYGPYF